MGVFAAYILSLLIIFFLTSVSGAAVDSSVSDEFEETHKEGDVTNFEVASADEEDSGTSPRKKRSRRDASSNKAESVMQQDCGSCGSNPMPIVARNYTATTCVDHMEHGASRCGHYVINDGEQSYVVFCDINTEVGFAYTLIESFALKYNSVFINKGLTLNWPINENSPNWNIYRLSHGRMSRIRHHSTYWRATCEFQSVGIDYRDYVRAKLAEVDPVAQALSNTCKTVEYINLRGHVGLQTTVPFWNSGTWHMHTDSTYPTCAFKPKEGSVSGEDNWGFYQFVNPKFRCTANTGSTTQYWMGDYVRGKGKGVAVQCKGCDKVY